METFVSVFVIMIIFRLKSFRPWTLGMEFARQTERLLCEFVHIFGIPKQVYKAIKLQSNKHQGQSRNKHIMKFCVSVQFWLNLRGPNLHWQLYKYPCLVEEFFSKCHQTLENETHWPTWPNLLDCVRVRFSSLCMGSMPRLSIEWSVNH